MIDDSVTLIEEWFANQRDDGDFVCCERSVPYKVIGPSSTGQRIVFTTKPTPVAFAIEACKDSADFGMIGRYGLPNANDATWIGRVVGSHKLFFLGDLDPVDLMVFAWLQGRLRPIRVTHLGVNDAYLDELQVFLPGSFIMACSSSEQRSLPALEKVLPNFREMVGPQCATILQRGQKIELEAIVSAKQTAAPILLPALAREGS